MKDSDLLLERLPDGVLVIDAEGTGRFMNAAAEHVLRTSRERCLGAPMAEILERAPAILQLTTDAISSPGVRVFRHGAQSALPSSQRTDAVAVAGASGAVIVCLRDASLSAELVDDARRTDHIEAMQAVASGLAHEIKNPLGGIRGAVQLLSRELAEDAAAREYIDVVLREIDRVSYIVDHLQSLANPPEAPELVSVDLNRVLREIALLQEAGDDETEFVLELDPALPAPVGDSAALTTAFLNLVRNAREAGATQVILRSRVVTGVTFRDEVGNKHPLVEVEVIDNGPGIPEELVQQVFTPFFTTKANGSGFGLATTQRVIASHSGHIVIERASDSGGARFVVTLPAMGNG